jgi:hypothetical protein
MASSSETSTGPYKTNGGKLSRRGLLKFLIPSVFGVGMFLVPFTVGDGINIGMGYLADGLKALLGDALPPLAALILCLSAALTVLVKLTKPAWLDRGPLKELFDVEWLWAGAAPAGRSFRCHDAFSDRTELRHCRQYRGRDA